MKLTEEQSAIVNSTGNIKINAVAGSGKTTTIIEYIKARPQKRALYLAFNKTVRQEAVKKFEQAGISWVKVETAHSLAYKNVVPQSGYSLSTGYKTYELKDLLEIEAPGDEINSYILANHILKYAAYFCNSNAAMVKDLNLLDIISDETAALFVKRNYDKILLYTRQFLAKMYKGEIGVTHDFYLKKYQLSDPLLNYDYIFFDEGQDASPVMLDVFMKQKAAKIIVGDAHQQIYSWRYAVNSLEQVDFKNFTLSKSFRFEKEIGNLAENTLCWKKNIQNYSPIDIEGIGKNKSKKMKATIGRTNTALMLRAIDLLIEKQAIENVYFEGNISSYTYAEEGGSIYDVLNLKNGDYTFIRDNLIKSMQSFSELEEYAEATEDGSLKMLIDVVKKYGRNLPNYIKILKDKHLPDEMREDADMIFSTVHRCKGMEYDEVTILDDFIKETDIKNMVRRDGLENIQIASLAEEINLLYVAITRTKNILNIPFEFLPDNYKEFKKKINSKINVLFTAQQTNKKDEDQKISGGFFGIRKKHKDAYKKWTTEDDADLLLLYDEGKNLTELSKHFGRTAGAVRTRLQKLGVFDN